jgi:UrcA family protein
MSRSLLIGFAAIAGVTIAPIAMAQDGAIVVSGPRYENVEGAKGVHPQRMLVANVSVPTHDLDLRTDYGRDVLDHRVEMAAREVCAHIDYLEPASGPGANPISASQDCRLQAKKSAMAQMRAAIWAAG